MKLNIPISKETAQRIKSSLRASGVPSSAPKKKVASPSDEEREAAAGKSCVTCTHFIKCTNEKKNWNYFCGDFKKRSASPLNAIDVLTRKGYDVTPHLIEEIIKDSDADLEEIEEAENLVDVLVDKFNSNRNPFGLIDLKIEDGDLPASPNFLDFIETYQNNEGISLSAKQYEVALNYFSEICWNAKCTNLNFANNFPFDAKLDDILENVTLLHHGQCPKCKKTRLDFWKARDRGPFFELAGMCGQRSGKSMLFSLMAVYYLHHYLKLGQPGKVLGVGSVKLHFTYTAGTYAQAKSSLFDYSHNQILDNAWFGQFNEILEYSARKKGINPEKFYRIMDTMIVYDIRNFAMYAQAPDPRNQRGYTRIGAGIDEIGHIGATVKDAIKLDPDKIYEAIGNALTTVQDKMFKIYEDGNFRILNSLFGSISSPLNRSDKICRLIERGNDPNEKNLYTFHYSSKEFNPSLSERTLRLQRQRLGEVIYNRDYMAIPPNAASPFIEDESIIDNMQGDYKNSINLKPKETDSISDKTKTKYAVPKFVNPTKKAALMALDAGYSGNSFAGCVMTFDEEGKRIEALFEVMPDVGKNVLSHSLIYDEVLTKIFEYFNIKLLLADRWNSIKLLQDAQAQHDVVSQQYSLKYQDFQNFRNDLQEGIITCPLAEIELKDAMKIPIGKYPKCFEFTPVTHFLVQCATVEDLMGKRIDKGAKRTDDLFRAAVLASWAFDQDDLAEIVVGTNYDAQIQEDNPYAGYLLKGGASGARGNGPNSLVADKAGNPFAILYRR